MAATRRTNNVKGPYLDTRDASRLGGGPAGEGDYGAPRAALNRLQDIAANGLDDPALSGLDDKDPDEMPTDEAARDATAGRTAAGHTAAGDAAADRLAQAVRVAEAMIFAAPQPVAASDIAAQLPAGTDIGDVLGALETAYEGRGIELVRVGRRWTFRTAGDLGYLLERHAVEERRLSKAALETLAIVAYHQPVTRAEIEEIRGVQTSRGTLDVLMETSWVRPRGRRRAPGKPVTYGTSDAFLEHFGLDTLGDLPGLAELKGAGLLDSQLPPDFEVPSPKDVAALMPDELPLEDDPGDDSLDEDPAAGMEDPTADDADDRDEAGEERSAGAQGAAAGQGE